jgi:hypothetical protein
MKNLFSSLFLCFCSLCAFAQTTIVRAGIGESVYKLEQQRHLKDDVFLSVIVAACHRDKSLTVSTTMGLKGLYSNSFAATTMRVSSGDSFVLADTQGVTTIATVDSIQDCHGEFHIRSIRR